MPFSVVMNGIVEDIQFRKLNYPNDIADGYIVTLGDQTICQCYKAHDAWSVVVHGDNLNNCLRHVNGFASRRHCVVYALRVLKIYNE